MTRTHRSYLIIYTFATWMEYATGWNFFRSLRDQAVTAMFKEVTK